MTIQLSLIKQGAWIDNFQEEIRKQLQEQLHLEENNPDYKTVFISNNLIQRFCLLVGLSMPQQRTAEAAHKIKLKPNTLHDTVFSKHNYTPLWTALLKLRYRNCSVDWDKQTEKSKVINFEMEQGAKHLLEGDNIKNWLIGLVK